MHGKFNRGRLNLLEEWLFYLVLVLNLLPIVSVAVFPTLDGPAHLYNSDLIKSILFTDGSFASNFFQLQSEAVPNWTGHLFLMLLGTVFSPEWTQKIFLIFLVGSLPLIFRSVLKSAGNKHYWFSWLIFPFTYSFIFFLGFYNFLLGIILMFLTMNYHLRNIHKAFHIKQAGIYFLLFFLCYFSHVFVFAMLMCSMALMELFTLLLQEKGDRNFLTTLFKRAKVFLPALPFLLLLVHYFSKRPTIGEPYHLSYTELIDWIKNIRPIIALHFQIEEVFTKKLFYLISALTVIAIYELLKSEGTSPSVNKEANKVPLKFKLADAWLAVTVLFLFLYFYLPDSDGNAGFVSVRMGLLFFLFLVLWISAQPLPQYLGMFAAGVAVFCNFSLNQYYLQEIKIKSEKIEDIIAAKKLVSSEKTLLPLNFEEDWILGHSPNWFGVGTGVVVLENYEAGTDYFPLRWKETTLPHFAIGGVPIDKFPCIGSKNNHSGQLRNIDYIYKMGNKRDTSNICENQLFSQVEKGYDATFRGKHGVLWRKKN